MKSAKKETLVVHSSNRSSHGGVVSSIDPSSSYRYIDEGPRPYPRYFNTPNQRIVIDQICQLESAEAGLVFSSGMAAITTTLVSLLSQGDHIVLQRALYGGTHCFVLKEFKSLGIEFTLADCDAASLANAIQPNTRVVYAETPANPLMQIVDLQELAARVSGQKIISVVDNTFASPVNQNPIELGIDIVVHSGTKYLGGHSDLCFGAVVGSTENIEKVYEKAILYGGNLNPLSLYLIERSLKTLFVRVNKQNQNAMEVASFLNQNCQIENVYYPGLSQHPGHAIASKQMQGFGGMMSFQMPDNITGKMFLEKLKLITPAMSLGGVESTATIPALTSHKPLPKKVREAAGITEQLVRLSIGIESADDLIADIEQALNACAAQRESLKPSQDTADG